MPFNRELILAEGGTYHGAENPLTECAAFTATNVSYVGLHESGAPLTLKEDANLPKRMVIEGVFQRADVRNANQRMYPRSLWERLLAADSNVLKRIAERSMIGHLEHPTEGTTDLNKGAILVTKVWMESDGTVMGRALVYNTPEGLRLQEYIATGTKIGISSRGTGTVDHRGVVCEDFALETWDMVFNPSTPGANPTLKTESVPAGHFSDARVVEAAKVSDTLPASQEKTMSLSARIHESSLAVKRLLAVDPAKLPVAERAAHAAAALDLRVKIAEEFTGERRVAAVKAMLESLKAYEDTMSGEVGGYTDAPVAGQNPDNTQGDGTGVPGNPWDVLAKGLSTMGDGDRTKATEDVGKVSQMIAANMGKLPQIVKAVESAVHDAPITATDADIAGEYNAAGIDKLFGASMADKVVKGSDEGFKAKTLTADREYTIHHIPAENKFVVKTIPMPTAEGKLTDEDLALLQESQEELAALTEAKEAASAIILEMRKRLKEATAKIEEAETAKAEMAAQLVKAEEALAELTAVDPAKQVKESIEAVVRKHPELDAFRSILEKAESPAVVEATAATLVKSIEEKAAKRLAESAPAKPLSFKEKVAQRIKKVDESLPKPGQEIHSAADAAETVKEAVTDDKQARILEAMAKSMKRIHD